MPAMWTQLVSSFSKDVKFAPGVSADRLVTADISLGVTIPDALRNLLLETDGLTGQYGEGLIWQIGRIETENAKFRSDRDFQELYMPFDNLLFFADYGNGDQFAYPIRAGSIRCDDIFVWKHENDSRSWIAPSLEKYLEWNLTGKIEL